MDYETQTDFGDQMVNFFEEKITKDNGQVIIKKYQKGNLIGKGSFAMCYEATDLETQRTMAAKIVAKSSLTKNRTRQRLISEIKIHKSLQNINIVKFEHVFEDHENIYILLELCSNQTLNELIKRRKRLTEIEVQCCVGQIINSLRYLHSFNIIHRDLKLGNVLLNKQLELKLGNFKSATELKFDGERKKTICGTQNYIAPEMLDGKVGHSFEVDIWSLGVMIYAMLIGKLPFETSDVKTTYQKIKLDEITFPENVLISDSAKNLIIKILRSDPTKRLNLDEIMAHPFMDTGCTIPKVLPLSTLACPPSASYIKQFQPQLNTSNLKLSVQAMPQRLTETNPINQPKETINANTRHNNGSSNRFALTKPGSSANILEEQFGSSNLNNGQNGGYGGPNRPQSQKPTEIRNSQSQRTLNNPPFNATGMTGVQSVNNLAQQSLQKSEIYVKKWVDYSNKYGLGYLLSNGATGVSFNDGTKIVLDPRTQIFDYIEKRGTDKQDVIEQHGINNYPSELQKKVTLLEHFKSYLKIESLEQTEEFGTNGTVYVKKWIKTIYAIMFRLSNDMNQQQYAISQKKIEKLEEVKDLDQYCLLWII